MSREKPTPDFSIYVPVDSETNRQKGIEVGVHVDPGLKNHLQKQDEWDGLSTGGDDFLGMLERRGAVNTSEETVSKLHDFFHKEESGLSLSQWLLDKFEVPLYRGSLMDLVPTLKNHNNEIIAAGYAHGGAILNRILKKNHIWHVETNASEMDRLITARPLSLDICAIASGYSTQESPNCWFLGIYYYGKEILIELPAGFVLDKFLGLHLELMLRVLIAVLCREEIARRIQEVQIKRLFAELAYSKKPDPQAYETLIATFRKAVRNYSNGEDTEKVDNLVRDQITAGLEKLRGQSSEQGEIIAMLSMAFSGLRAQGSVINLKKKASTKAEKKTVALVIGQVDEEKGAIEEERPVVDFIHSDLIKLSEHFSDDQKAQVDEAHGGETGAILELMFIGKSQKEIAKEIGLSEPTISRRLKSIGEKGDNALLELLYPEKRWENLLREAGKEALKAP